MRTGILLRGTAAFALILGASQTYAQEALPEIDVGALTRPATNPQNAPAVTPTASSPASSAKEGGGDRFTGYAPPPVAEALKTDTPIMQTPIAVQVVPRETIDDQQAIGVQDAILTNVSSISANQLPPYPAQFTIRGFNVGQNIFRDGLREQQEVYFDTTDLSAIEIIKGPAAMEYGRIEPGGLVNLVSKQPLDHPYYSVQEQAGSYGLTRTTVDATGPLTEDKSLLYRLNAEYLSGGTFTDYTFQNNFLVSPSILWHPIEQFKILVDAQYQHYTGVDNEYSFPAVGARPAPVPLSANLEDTGITGKNPDQEYRSRLHYQANYDINKDWTLTNRFAYIETYQNYVGTFFGSFDQTSGTANPLLEVSPQHFKTLSTNLDLKGKFETGPLQHSVLVGVDYFNQRSDNWYACFCYSPYVAPNLNIYAPVGGPGLLAPPDYSQVGGAYYARQDWKGLYAQDQISAFEDRVHLLLGGRYDWASTATGDDYNPNGGGNGYDFANYKATITRDNAFSPRVGLVIQPQPWLSFYGSYTQSLGANNGINAQTNAPLPPQHATQWEAGIKAQFFDKGLTATLAYFDITKTNIPSPVAGNPNESLLVGAARSQGVELDITGRINENWSVIINATHDDARVTQAPLPYSPNNSDYNNYNNYINNLYYYNAEPAGVVGNRLPSVPENAANFWVKYEADGQLKGLSVGGGFSLVGQQQGDYANSFQLPSYALLNGMIAYRFEYQKMHITAQLNVRNITDATYYSASASRFAITPGTPRTILASLRFEF
jgi:iron complex outermembrane recepter protein